MRVMGVVYCDVKKVYLRTYRDYEIYYCEQVDQITGKPFADGGGSKWYSAVNPIINDSISDRSEAQLIDELDYRLKANPNMIARMYKEAEEKRRKARENQGAE